MGLVCKPQIEVEDITVEIDKESEEAARRILNTWGSTIPLIKIGEYFVNPSELVSFELNVSLNNIPSFTIELTDNNLTIRKALKASLDKCIIFIGYKEWYIKFNGLISHVTSEIGDANVMLVGICFNELLYQNIQKAYVDVPLDDVVKDIAEQTKMGLFTVENKWLTEEHDFILNANKRYINFFDWCLKNYTENLWCIDPLYHFHIADITELRKNCESDKRDKYTLKQDGTQIDETDIIFNSYQYPTAEGTDEEALKKDDKKLRIDYYTINTNYSEMFKDSSTQYLVNGSEELVTDNEMGYGTSSVNTFAGNGSEENVGFLKHSFPFYSERINKLIGGTLIRISLKNIMFELSPFDVVGFECYLPSTDDKPQTRDEEHSGNKIVIGYSYKFDKSNEDVRFPLITQTIDLI